MGIRVGPDDCCELKLTWLEKLCCRPLVAVLQCSHGQVESDAKPAGGRPLVPGASMVVVALTVNADFERIPVRR